MRCPANCGSDPFSREDARKRHRREACGVCAGCERRFDTPKERHTHEMKACGMVDKGLEEVLCRIWNSKKKRGVEDEDDAETEEQPTKRRKTH